VDAFRFDMFNQEIMPNTYSYFQNRPDAFYFTNHLSGGNATQAGVFSLFYSIPSTYWNTITAAGVPPVFITELVNQNYSLGIFSSAKLNSPEFFKNVFVSVENLRIGSQGNTIYEQDINMEKDFEEFILQRDKSKNFFGFLFYDAPHSASYPENYPEKFAPVKVLNYIMVNADTDPTPYLNRYKNSVDFVDGNLKRLFEFLKKQGLQDNTIIILSADHGEEFNDNRNNFWSHNGNYTKWQIRVPMLVFWPGKKGNIINYRTSHYDIIPTLMQDVLGVQNDIKDYSLGYNLFDIADRRYIISASYTDKAVISDSGISVINNYGTLKTYDDNYKPVKNIDGAAIKDALDDMSKFYD